MPPTMFKAVALALPLLATSVQLESLESAASAGGCGSPGPQGPAGPRGPAGPAGYGAVAFNEGTLVDVAQGTQSTPVALTSVQVTSAEQGKVLVSASGTCDFNAGAGMNFVTVAIRAQGETGALPDTEGVNLSVPRASGVWDTSSRGSFSVQRLVDVNAGVPATFSVMSGRPSIDPALGTSARCRAQVSALFVKSTF